MLTLPGDIPLIKSAEIEPFWRRTGRPSFTIAPSHDEKGSNAIVMSPPDAVKLRFGDDSFFPHLPPPRHAALRLRYCTCPGSPWISTIRPISRIFRVWIAHASGPVARGQQSCTWCRGRNHRRDVMPPQAGWILWSNAAARAASEGQDMTPEAVIDRAATGARLGDEEALALAGATDLAAMMAAAAALRDAGHGRLVSYSKKCSSR